MYDLVVFPILALDVGFKRIGVAFLEGPAGAADFKKIFNREGNKALDQILEILKQKKVKTLLAGMPLLSNGERSEQCEDVEKFCRRIARRFTLELVFVDEYLSSVEAQRGKSKDQKVDDVAAEIILKRYLVEKGLLPDYM